jgi:ethanolamine utilization protein EutA (predicted chaperonin)
MGLNQMEPSSGTQVLYGTNINSSEVQMKIRNFINTFIQMDENDDKFDQMPYYIEQLRNINETESYILDVNCDHVFEFD